MKKLILLMTALSLLLCGQAMAAKQTFDSKAGKFSIVVPDGWSAQALPEGCKISSKDDKNILSLQLMSAKNMEPQTIANDLAKELNITVKKETSDEKGTWLEGEMMEMPTGILSVKKDSVILVSLLAGTDRDTMKEIFDSVRMTAEEVKFIQLEAGPIWDNDFAKKRCPELLEEWLKAHPDMNAEWTGSWTTTVAGQMSICTIKTEPK